MLTNYLKIAWRNIVRNKVYSFINVGGLALGMTCGLLIFLLVSYHLSFDNFHDSPNRVYRIVTEMHRDVIDYTPGVPSPLGKAFRSDYDFAEKVARIASEDNMAITVRTGKRIEKFNEVSGVAIAEPEYFDIFNFPLVQGNIKTALLEPNTAIITEHLAKKYFGDQNPLGKTIEFGSTITAKITGILKDLPQNTDHKTEIFVSYPTLKQYSEWLASDDAWGGVNTGMQCYVRLRPQVSVAQVEQVLPAYVTRHRPTSTNVHHYKLQPLNDIHFNGLYGGTMSKRNLWVLAFIGIFMIATACVNFINLATAQALKRAKEVGVRKVLGSLRGQLFWQFIAQTGIITVISFGLAVILSIVALPYINNWFKVQIGTDVLSDWQLLAFIPVLVLVVTFFAGAYPGLVLAGFQPVVALKGKLSQQNIGGFNTRRGLIIVQFALAQVLIIGLIVIAKQMNYSIQSDLGFDKEAIVMIPIGSDYQKARLVKGQFEQLADVKDVTLCFAAPASNGGWSTTPKYDNNPKEEEFRVSVKAADAKYAKTFGLRLVAGRNVFPADSTREFVVNEAFARKLNLDAPGKLLGKMLTLNGQYAGPIVGVVGDFHDLSFHEEISPIALFTAPDLYQTFAIKINTGNIANTVAALEKTWNASNPDKLFSYKFLDDDIASFYETETLMLTLIQAFSFLALFIGCLGLYGLVSFMAEQKTKEIGIRKVLGSSVGQVLWIFGKEFAQLLLIAFIVAAPLAWWLMTGWLTDFKFHIEISAGVFMWALVSVFSVALLTVSYQAIRASLMNPVKSLRSE